MKCIAIEPISIGGERVEPGCEVELEASEFLTLSKHGAVEPAEAWRARKAADVGVAKARAEAEAVASKMVAEAEAAARKAFEKATSEAEAKVDKTVAASRARVAKPAEA